MKMRTTIPIIAGKEGVTSGKINRPELMTCTADGSVNIEPKYGDSYTVDFVAGSDRMFEHPLPIAVTVNSGTFSFA